jgi:hypothetical protein
METNYFRGFRAFMSVYGLAGSANEWHHIVEQCQIKKTRSAFDPGRIHAMSNMVPLTREQHLQISKYYSKKLDSLTEKK